MGQREDLGLHAPAVEQGSDGPDEQGQRQRQAEAEVEPLEEPSPAAGHVAGAEVAGDERVQAHQQSHADDADGHE